MTNEKKYLASCDNIDGFSASRYEEDYKPVPPARDWLEVPEEVVEQIEKEPFGIITFYVFEDGTSSLKDESTEPLKETVRVAWSKSGWCYESTPRLGIGGFRGWEYNATLDEIIGLLGGAEELTEEQKNWFRAEGENI